MTEQKPPEPGRTTRTTHTLLLLLFASLILSSCGNDARQANSPTSGQLILFVEEGYAPLFARFAKQFEERVGKATIEVRPVTARNGVEELINTFLADTAKTDTSVAYALIIARHLLEDEQNLIASRKLDANLKKEPIAYDALALGVAESSPIEEATVQGIRASLMLPNPSGNDLIPGGPTTSIRFLFSSPNSSSYSYVRDSLLADSNQPVAPFESFENRDEMRKKVANGQGVVIDGWYLISDSTGKIRTLRVGNADGRPPVRVHTTSLVMGLYPMKLPLIGYTLGPTNALGYGFLKWVAHSQDPQQELAMIGFEPENVRFELTRDE